MKNPVGTGFFHVNRPLEGTLQKLTTRQKYLFLFSCTLLTFQSFMQKGHVMDHIAEPGFVNRSVHFTDDEYARVLNSIVVCCVDCVVVYGDEMLFGKRMDEPAKED